MDEPVRWRVDAGTRRAWCAFAAFALGVWCAHELWRFGVVAPGWVWAVGAAALAAVAIVATGRACAAALAAGAALLGGAWFTTRALESPADALVHQLDDGDGVTGGMPLTIDGVVVGVPEPWGEARGELAAFSRLSREGWSFVVRARTRVDVAEPARISGTVQVLTPGRDPPGVGPGDVVRVSAMGRSPSPPRNPGSPDFRLWSAARGEGGSLVVSDASLIVARGRAPGWDWFVAAAARGQRALRERASSILPAERAGAMTRALLLGEREVSDDLSQAFARQGVAHVLAISGFHLAVLAGAALFVVRLTGDRGWPEPVTVGVFVAAYVVIVPAEAPVVRAGAMVLALLAGEALGRRHDRLGLLAWIALGLLVWRPMDLWSLGYQLSVGLTAVLLWLGDRAHARVFRRPLGTRYERPDAFDRAWWVEGAQRLVSASVLCWLVSLAWIARAVGAVSPLAALTTVLITPIVTVMLWVGAVLLAVGMAAPGLGAWSSGVLAALGASASGVVGWLDALPGTAWPAPPLSLALTLGWTVWALALFARTDRDGLPARGAHRPLRAGAAALVVWTAGELLAPRVLGPDLRLDTFAVGDGTCHALRSGGEVLLWDCGSLESGIGLGELPRAMAAVGVRRAPTVVLTHANLDHYSALLDVAPRLGVRRVLMHPTFASDAASEDGPAAYMLAQLAARGIEAREVRAGESLALGRCVLTFLGPPEGRLLASANDHSLVARVESPTGARVLLTGDIQQSAMEALDASGADVRADVLELPHHGSVTPASSAFMARVGARVVVQSTGPGRLRLDRWALARDRLEAGGGWWLVTARDGWGWVEVRRDGTIRAGALRRGPGLSGAGRR